MKPLHVGAPNLAPWGEFAQLARGAFGRRWLTNRGPLVQQLEAALQEQLGVAHVIACANGTVALELAARAAELRGEVILPSFTFVATAHALQWQGLRPVFADVDPDTYNLDPAAVEALITPATSAIVGVHLYGRPCAIAPLQELADRHGLALLFDAAHAFGCAADGRAIGSHGLCEVFSFHATKVFNTGEGGAIATNDGALAERVRLLQNFGFAAEDRVVALGLNGKMSELNAALGLANLRHLPRFVATNRRHHGTYRQELDGVEGLRVIDFGAQSASNYHYVIVEVDADHFGCQRDALRDHLTAHGVLARRYFTPGCHRQPPYSGSAAADHLPQTERLSERLLALPNGMQLGGGDMRRICRLIQTCPRGVSSLRS
ncbi:MAG: DegT/DnrJ/EryC1/StrS family aminotransferase [Cyanobacteriota bacterium]|nr:DegT/DnrJ/EryC1/StrS family aminotransferase [Cyanobacteriota bacterium]